jgi:hypothetical protein
LGPALEYRQTKRRRENGQNGYRTVDSHAKSGSVLETTKRLFDHTRGVRSNVNSFLRHVRSA